MIPFQNISGIEQSLLKLTNFNKKHVKMAYDGEIQAISKVKSFNKLDNKDSSIKHQKLEFKMIGVHPNKCRKALRKISLYEEYSDFIGFIKKVSFSESRKRLSFHINHTLMPYPMVLQINIGRVSGPGVYPYSFAKGIFSGLKGNIVIKDYKKRCLISINNKWSGKHTKIPNLVIEIFSQTLMRIGMEKVFRFSRI
jgi:hypothetical protein